MAAPATPTDRAPHPAGRSAEPAVRGGGAVSRGPAVANNAGREVITRKHLFTRKLLI